MKLLNRIIPFLLVITSSNLTIGQSIIDIQKDINDIDMYRIRQKPVLIVKMKTTFFKNKKSNVIEEDMLVVSDKMYTVVDITQTGKTEILTSYKYNKDGKKYFKSVRKNFSDKSYIEVTDNYYYNEDRLIKIKQKTSENNVITNHTIADVVTNSKYDITKMDVSDANRKLLRTETGTYNYDNNKWIHTKTDHTGNARRKNTKRTYKINTPTKHNEQGDIVSYVDQVGKHAYKISYKYDEFNNWTTKTVSRISLKRDSTKEKILYSETTRVLEYSN